MPQDPVPSPSHRALYRRWRAQTFGQIVGQTAVVETLRNGVRLGRLAHGLLFVGPRGTGKTSMARIVAKAVNCPNVVDGEPDDSCPSCEAIREGRALDVIELDAASNNRVDDMRELVPRVYTAPADLRRKVFIIDEVQRIKEGWDVLLKTLEEPPDDVLFIFCTTNPSGIRPAVVSRLQRFLFRPLTVEEIAGKLGRILEADGRSAEPAAIELVARLAAGGMRDAESMLDQLLSTAGDPLTAEAVHELLGLADAPAVDAFVDALVTGDALAGIGVLDTLEAEGRDLVAFGDQVVERLRRVVVERLAGRPGPTAATADISPATLAGAARRLTGLDANRSSAGGYRFQLELTLFGAGGGGTGVAAAAAPTTTRALGTVVPTAPTAPVAGRSPARRTQSVTEPPVPRPEPSADEPPLPAPEAASDVAPDPKPKATAQPARAEAPAGPASPTAPPATGAPAAVGADELLVRLRERWPEVVAQVGRNPANRPIIAACRPVEVRDGIVVLGFPEHQPFLREKAEQRRSALEDGLAVVLGRTVGVRCVSTNLEALPPVASADDDIVAEARRVFAGDVADVAEIS